jgi:hypothetical protein
MVSNGSGSWYNRPARPFPARVWLATRYPFTVSPSVFARLADEISAPPAWGRRPFPAKVWLASLEKRSRNALYS